MVELLGKGLKFDGSAIRTSLNHKLDGSAIRTSFNNHMKENELIEKGLKFDGSAVRTSFNNHINGNELGKGFKFDGFAITSIDYKKEPKPGRPNRVTFAEYTPGIEDKMLKGKALKKHNATYEDAATFLSNIKYLSGEDKDGKRLFEADAMSTNEAYKAFQEKYGETVTPLFVIHGYNTEPGSTLKTCKEAQLLFNKGGRKTAIIPIMWPSNGKTLDYFIDRYWNVPEAKKELSMLLQGINVFQSKQLLAHSMGNRLLRMVANENIKFDNIFMVASDIRHDIFHKEYIETAGHNENAPEFQGMQIFRMLTTHIDNGKPKGKIYCLYSKWDLMLKVSRAVNFVPRLGQVGTDKHLVHPRILGYVDNFNVETHFPIQQLKQDKKGHSYQWAPPAISFYREKIESQRKRQ